MTNNQTVGDPYVFNTQQWLNDTYGDDSRFNTITENGKTGWDTIYALTRALQIELGIQSTADNFGPSTISKFKEQYPNGVQQQDDEEETKRNIYGIIQGALLCKGYAIGANKPTCNFYGGTGAAVKSLKEDAGLTDTTSTVTLNIMQALLSMDYFYSYDTSARTQNIINMQRYLNRNYEAYIGIRPCDGVYARRTSQALIYAIQAEEGMPTSVANGNCGPSTKAGLPTLSATGTSSGTGYNGQPYSTETLNRFKILANIALYFNGFGSGELTSSMNSNTIKSFQSKYAIGQSGNIDYTTWLSLLISCGNTERSAIACDCMTKINANNVSVLTQNGYQYIGRYLVNATNGRDKKITKSEIQTLFNNGIRLFPIYQTVGTSVSYFSSVQGVADAINAAAAADELELQFGTTIYFAVDCDPTDTQITNSIIPYFKAVFETLVKAGKLKYRVGVYGTRNVCTRVSEAGYAWSSFVSDMSTGYSGNLGFSIPDNWALDQFTTVTISANGQSIEIDKNGFSGQYKGISQEYSNSHEYSNTIEEGGGRILINMTETSVPVYAQKTPVMPEVAPVIPAYEVTGGIIGYIKPHDTYVRYQVSNPSTDNVHKVMFNDGTDVKVGYITEKNEFASMTENPLSPTVVDLQILPGHEPFTCVEYNPSNDSYIIHDFDTTSFREFNISRPVAFIDEDGNFEQMLVPGDIIRIAQDNFSNPGQTRPWTTRIDAIKYKGDPGFSAVVGYVPIGLEYAGSGPGRTLY